MNGVVIDIGNSAAKWAVLTDQELTVSRHDVRGQTWLELARQIAQAVDGEAPVWVSSVADARANGSLQEALAEAGLSRVEFCRAQAREGGLLNSYADPDRMGVDRWLAMLGAWCSDPGPLLVIDAGSALTCDLVAGDGQHLGGYILPGPGMMESSLLSQTQGIRYEARELPSLEPGCSTAACVGSGIWAAAVGAVNEVHQRYGGHKVILTGGDAGTLMALGVSGDWRPNLVLEGLAERARRTSGGE